MIRRIAALAGLFALVAGAAAARPYPSEPVRFLVSYPAGGATAPAVLPQIQAGRLTAPAVTSARRQPGLPDVPTVAESGFPGFGCDAWFAVFAPAGTAEAIVARLNADIRAVLAEPEVIARLKDQGVRGGDEHAGRAAPPRHGRDRQVGGGREGVRREAGLSRPQK